MKAVIRRDDMIVVSIDGVPYTVYAEDKERYDGVRDLLDARASDDELREYLSDSDGSEDLVEELFEAGLDIQFGTENLTYKGNPLPGDLSGYIRSVMKTGDATAVVNFVQRLYENASENTRMTLFRFLEANHLPIMEDGSFLAYKVVRENYMDKHSGEFDNSPGSRLDVEWSDVDLDPNKTCSRGLHVCSSEYITGFYSDGDRVVTVAVYPEDVGAVPYDYNGSKMRTRGYRVVADITERWVEENKDILLTAEDAGDLGVDWTDEDQRISDDVRASLFW